MPAEIRFTELLKHNEEETGRWCEWFAQRPETLDLKVDLMWSATVRDALFHIFTCEFRYAGSLAGGELDLAQAHALIASLPHQTVEDLFAIGSQARGKFGQFLQCATDADWESQIPFPEGPWGKLTPTKRKCFAHVMFHSMRHWAQLATELRKQGLKQEWGHDLLFTHAIA